MKTFERRQKTNRSPAPASSEITGAYRCRRCGNITEFVGYDDCGYPGDACECGKVVCECKVTLRQPFRVNRGEVVYEAFTGGGCDSEIGSYDRIHCGRCGAQIWPKPKAPQHPDLDVANPQGSSSTEFGIVGIRPAGSQFRRKARRRSSEPNREVKRHDRC
jgi:hypothetical protein